MNQHRARRGRISYTSLGKHRYSRERGRERFHMTRYELVELHDGW